MRRRFYFCACTKPKCMCDGDFIWYEPQDLAKAARLAIAAGYEGFWVPYKLCGQCRGPSICEKDLLRAFGY